MSDFFIQNAHAFNTGVSVNGKTSFKDFGAYVNAWFNWGVKLGFALCVLMYIYAGIKYITSQGNQSALNDAKDIMINTSIGFVMLLLIFTILSILGIDK